MQLNCTKGKELQNCMFKLLEILDITETWAPPPHHNYIATQKKHAGLYITTTPQPHQNTHHNRPGIHIIIIITPTIYIKAPPPPLTKTDRSLLH